MPKLKFFFLKHSWLIIILVSIASNEIVSITYPNTSLIRSISLNIIFLCASSYLFISNRKKALSIFSFLGGFYSWGGSENRVDKVFGILLMIIGLIFSIIELIKKIKSGKMKGNLIKKIKLPLVFEAIIMLFLPIVGFFLFSYLIYPLQPHCSLGSNLLGCTPMCEAKSYFEDGSPASYVVTPCFHEGPSAIQSFSYNKPIPYYLLFLLPLALIFFLMGAEKFYNFILRVLFYPYFLFKDNRKNKKFLSRLIIILLLLPLTIEWVIGYVVLITTILGINPFM